MFTSDDLRVTSAADFFDILPIFIFCAFIAPFIIVAYTVGAISDLVGWLD